MDARFYFGSSAQITRIIVASATMGRTRLDQRLAQAEQRAAEGAGRVAQQRRTIARLAADGLSTALAYELLHQFEEVQQQLVTAVEQLRAKAREV